MGTASLLRSQFKAALYTAGQSVLIHNDFNTSTGSSFEIRGLKSWMVNNPSQVVFQFPRRVDIRAGSVLQIRGRQELWKVVEVKDHLVGSEYIKFEVLVVCYSAER